MYPIRWIELDGCVNMRDVGGIPTVDGGRIEPGRLLRSDNLQELTSADVTRLVEDLGVTDVVDLRSFVELEREGPGPLAHRPDVRIRHFTLYSGDVEERGIPAGERELPWEARTLPGEPVVPVTVDHDRHWSRHYLSYLEQRPENVLAALRAVADAPGALVMHCAAGKDRTGTLVALALGVAGATPEAIAADYAASAERVPLILERLRRHPAYAENLRGKTVDEQSPRAQTMSEFLLALEHSHGGVLGWLAGHGWTDADTACLRAKLRRPSPDSVQTAANVGGEA